MIAGEQETVRVEDEVASTRRVEGASLRDAFLRSMPELTFGLVRARGGSLWLGPLEMVRFGPPAVSNRAVSWRIEGGLLTLAPGGSLTLRSKPDSITSSVEGYRPLLPAPVYTLTQLPFHRLITRLFLLKVRGRSQPPGVPAEPARRLASAVIDVAICGAVASLAPRRGRFALFIGLVTAYHLAAWSNGGQTAGGMLTRQRVVGIDGSPVTVGQALVRFLALPFAAMRLRALHDEAAGTEVVLVSM